MAAQPTVTPTTTAPVAEPPAVSLADRSFSGSRALADVRWLADGIGSRTAGSAAERSAAEGIASRLRALGFTVELQPFPIRAFEDRGSRLVAGADELRVRALLYSRDGTVEGPLVEGGLGRPGDLAGKPVRGAVVIVERGEITFAEKARNAAAAGAVGVLVYNRDPGLFSGSVGELSAIPIVALDRTSGQRLAEQARQGSLRVTLTVDARVVEGTSQNVVATLPGASDRVVLLGGHYDSVSAGPGANDNASGTAVVLELARTLAARKQDAPLPNTLRVVLFGAEEIGLVGSRHYVSTLSDDQRQSISAMLNFDMVGVGDRPAIAGTTRLLDAAERAATGQGIRTTRIPESSGGRSSDHSSFIDAGVDSVFFHRMDDPRYHTAEDRAEFVEASALADAGSMGLGVIDSIASSAR